MCTNLNLQPISEMGRFISWKLVVQAAPGFHNTALFLPERLLSCLAT